MPNEVVAQAALALILYEDTHSLRSSFTTSDPFSPFATEIGLRLNHTLTRTFSFNVCDDDVKVEVKYFNFSGIPYEKIAVILLSAYS